MVYVFIFPSREKLVLTGSDVQVTALLSETAKLAVFSISPFSVTVVKYIISIIKFIPFSDNTRCDF